MHGFHEIRAECLLRTYFQRKHMYSAGKTLFRNNRNCVCSNTSNVGIWWDETVPRMPQGSCFTQMTKQAPPQPTVMHSRNEAPDRKYSQYMNILCTRIHSKETSSNSYRRIIDVDVRVDSRAFHLGFVMDKVKPRQVLLRALFPYFPLSKIPPHFTIMLFFFAIGSMASMYWQLRWRNHKKTQKIVPSPFPFLKVSSTKCQ